MTGIPLFFLTSDAFYGFVRNLDYRTVTIFSARASSNSKVGYLGFSLANAYKSDCVYQLLFSVCQRIAEKSGSQMARMKEMREGFLSQTTANRMAEKRQIARVVTRGTVSKRGERFHLVHASFLIQLLIPRQRLTEVKRKGTGSLLVLHSS